MPELLLLLAVILLLVYWFPVRQRFTHWGATPEEVSRVMPGDQVIAHPTHTATEAITVNAPPEAIWPWLVQLGYQRGGLYSYDWLDRLFRFLDRPSASRILTEFQQLAVGDTITLGTRVELTVTHLQPARALSLYNREGDREWVWQFGLYPLGEGRTRLVSRGIEHMPRTFVAWLFMRMMEPASCIMTQRMLRGLKQRAEALERHLLPGQPQRASR
jgi:hypothetical protein